jgi:hypothetical protein
MIAGTLEIQLQANMARLQKDMADVKRVVGSTMSDVERIVGVTKAALGGLLAGLSVGAVAGFVRTINDSVDALNDLKDATGSSIENISALEDIAKRTGSSFDTVSAALMKMNKGLNAAKPGSDTERAFTALGLSVAELKRQDPAEALRSVSVALSGYADDANKARFAEEVFGKNLKEVAPLLKDLSEAGELNATVTTRQAEEAEILNKHLFVLQKNAQDAGRSLVANMVPAINAVIDAMKKGGVMAGLDELGNRMFDWEGNQSRKLIKRLKSDLDDLREEQAGITSDIFGAKGALQQQIDAKVAALDAAQKAYLKLTDGSAGGGRGKVNPAFVDARASLDMPDVSGAADKAKAATKAHTEALKEQAEQMRLGREAAMAMGDAVTDANAAYQKQQAEQTKAHEQYISSLDKSADSVAAQVQALQDENTALALSADQHISLAQAIQQVEIARLQEAQAVQMSYGDDVAAAAIGREIEKRKELITLMGGKEVREANVKAAKEAADDWKKTAESINNSITDALMRGFENGKGFAENFRDTVVNMFKSLVLRPVVSAIVNPVAGGITGMLGLNGAANAGDLAGLANSASSMGSMTAWLTDFKGGIASQVSKFGNYLSSSTNATMAEWGNSLMTNATDIGRYAEVAGNALGYLNAAVAASEGRWGAAIGSAVGTYFGPIGSAIGNAVGGWIDNAFGGGHEYTVGQGVTGSVSAKGASARNYQDWRNDGSSGLFGFGGAAASSGRNYSAADSGMVNGIAKAYAALNAQTASFAQALGETTTRIADYSYSFTVALGADAAANQAALEGMLKAANNAAASQVLENRFKVAGEGAADTLARLATSLSVVNGSFATLEKTLIGVSQDGGATASALITAMGGLQQYQASMAAYYQAFYTEDERKAKTLISLQGSFAALGLAMPSTIEGFRALVNAQDVSTESGRKAYAALIAMSGAFDSVTSRVDAVAVAFTDVASRIKDLLASISSEKANVASAKVQIGPQTVMTAEQIKAGIAAANVALPTNVTAANTAAIAQLNQANATLASAHAAVGTATVAKGAAEAGVNLAASKAENLPGYFKGLASQFHEIARQQGVYAYNGSATDYGNKAYAYDAASNRFNGWDNAYVNSRMAQAGATTTGAWDNAGLYGGFQQRARSIWTELDGANGKLAQSERDLVAARANLAAKTEAMKGPLAAEAAAAAAQVTAAANAKAAQLAYAEALKKYTVDASKSVTTLSKLREETVKYYESQKAIAATMAQSAANLNGAVATLRNSQLDDSQSLAKKQADFDTAYTMALSTTGATKAGYADKMTALLPELSAALQLTSGSREAWIAATAALTAKSEAIAAQLGTGAAAMNYQAESLAMLNSIDTALDVLGDSTKLITDAITGGAGLTAAGLREVIKALGGTPSFAVGTNYVPRDMLAQIHEGEAIVPKVYNPFNPAARRAGGNGGAVVSDGDSAATAAEVKAMREEIRAQARSNQALTIQLAKTQELMANIFEDWDLNGMPKERTAA